MVKSMVHRGLSVNSDLPPDYGWVIIAEPSAPRIATVVEIDEEGLVFVSRGSRFEKGDNLSVDLFFLDHEEFVLDLFCQVVSLVEESDIDPDFDNRARKWRVMFVDLDDARRLEIKHIIESLVN